MKRKHKLLKKAPNEKRVQQLGHSGDNKECELKEKALSYSTRLPTETLMQQLVHSGDNKESHLKKNIKLSSTAPNKNTCATTRTLRPQQGVSIKKDTLNCSTRLPTKTLVQQLGHSGKI